MTHKPKISIIIPVYNVEKYLRRCLDSVLSQTFTDWQAICVNDGSPDNSGEILSEYAARDKRFHIITQENGGQSQARNVGLAAAIGDYILYLDSDDFIHVQTLEILYTMVTQHNADMISFGYDVKFHRYASHLLAAGNDISELLPEKRNKVYKIGRIAHFVTDNILAHSTERNHSGFFAWHPVRRHCYPVVCMYSRKLVKNLNFIRGIIFEDFPWWVAVMLRRPRTVMIKTPLYFYMPNASSSLNSARARRMIESIVVGLRSAFELCRANATVSEFNRFNREFLWPFTIIAMRKVRDLDNDADINVVRGQIKKLNDMGVFAVAPTRRARRYQRRILEFIGDK